MNYGELKEQILGLAFEDDAYLDDANQAKVFRDGINKALQFVNVDFPRIGKSELTLTGGIDDYEDIDFSDLSDFDVVLNATIKKSVDGRMQILPFSDFVVEADTLVRVYSGAVGDVTFFYRKRVTPVTTSTADNVTLDVHYKAEPIVALLASYYIWADDDPTKAAQWRNEYEDMKTKIMSVPEPRPMRFVGGI